MKRASDADNGSLDLLLDTICNTFGGVLFISMLVVILLNMSSRQAALTPPDASAQAALVELERARSQTAAELRTLRDALSVQQQLERRIDDPGLREAVRRLREERDARTTRTAQADAARSRISQAQIDVNRVALSLAELQAARTRAAATLEQVDREMAREMAVRTRTARLPKLRQTTKTEVPFFLRQGRLCAFARRTPTGGLARNADEAVIRTDAAGVQTVEPVVPAGSLVNPAASSHADIEQKVAQFDKDRHFITLVVWPDSFAEFAVVKEILVRQQFEYRLLPWPDDEPITFGRSAGGALVQ
ncbi:MAG TPA: hypothetical protein VML55_11635 [Planctomycetaceae bacterium]|nr:hypothetical protein [Planctomycetaceae bacterium]